MSNVLEFGSKGDGVADDTKALQHTLDSGDGVRRLGRHVRAERKVRRSTSRAEMFGDKLMLQHCNLRQAGWLERRNSPRSTASIP